jgi:hypothetical protein
VRIIPAIKALTGRFWSIGELLETLISPEKIDPKMPEEEWIKTLEDSKNCRKTGRLSPRSLPVVRSPGTSLVVSFGGRTTLQSIVPTRTASGF